MATLIANGGGVLLAGDDNDDDDDPTVIHLVPRGASATHENSVAAQYIFKSAVDNRFLNIDDFRMNPSSDGTGGLVSSVKASQHLSGRPQTIVDVQ